MATYTAVTHPEVNRAWLVFTLGVSGVFCPLLAPAAWMLGRSELAAIDAGRRSPDGRSLAQVGKTLGLMVTAVMAVMLAVAVLLLGLAVVTTVLREIAHDSMLSELQ